MTTFNSWKASSLPRPAVFKVIGLQSCVALVVVGVVLSWNVEVAIPLLAGALIQLVPHSIFMFRSFARVSSAQMRNTVQSMYRGMSEKFLLTACLFALVFKFMPHLTPFWVFIGYGGMQLITWVATPVLFNRPRKR